VKEKGAVFDARMRATTRAAQQLRDRYGGADGCVSVGGEESPGNRTARRPRVTHVCRRCACRPYREQVGIAALCA